MALGGKVEARAKLGRKVKVVLTGGRMMTLATRGTREIATAGNAELKLRAGLLSQVQACPLHLPGCASYSL